MLGQPVCNIEKDGEVSQLGGSTVSKPAQSRRLLVRGIADFLRYPFRPQWQRSVSAGNTRLSK